MGRKVTVSKPEGWGRDGTVMEKTDWYCPACGERAVWVEVEYVSGLDTYCTACGNTFDLCGMSVIYPENKDEYNEAILKALRAALAEG